jgi:hypothetical protein
LPALIADGTSGIRCGGDARCAVHRRMIGVAEVRLLSSKNHILSLGTKIGGAKQSHKGQAAPHTYWEDTPTRVPKWTFLGRGSVPPKLDEDALTVVSMVALVVSETDRAYC